MSLDTLFEKTVKSSFWNVAGFIVSLAIVFITTPLLIKYLGTSSYGLMAILISILVPLGITNLGMGQATIKYVAQSLEEGDLKKAEEFLQVTLLFNIFIGILGSIVIILLARWLVESVFNVEIGNIEIGVFSLYLVALIWFFNQISKTLQGLLVAVYRYDILSICGTTSLVSKYVLGLLALYMGGNLYHYFVVQLVISMVEIGVWYIIIRCLIRGIKIFPKWHKLAFKKSFNYGVWQSVSQVGGIFANQADKYILGILLQTAAVGVYHVALSIEQRVIALVWKMAEVLFPSFSRISVHHNPKRTAFVVMRSSWLLGCIGAPLLITLGVFGKDFLQLWVGSEIADQGWTILFVMCIAGLFGISSQPVHFYLLGYGYTKWVAFLSILQGLIVLPLSYIFIKYNGILGAGFAGLTTMVLTRPLTHFFLWRYFFRKNIQMKQFFTAIYTPVIIGILGLLGIMWLKTEIGWFITNWVELGLISIVLVMFFTALIAFISSYIFKLEFVRSDIDKVFALFIRKIWIAKNYRKMKVHK